jgi:hypothetical protein
MEVNIMYVESMGMSVGNMANTATANINTVRQAGTANAAPVKQPAADAGTVKQTGESISSIPAKQTVTSAAENTVRTESADTEQAKKDIAEDGYWGVEQTSDRIIDFATALTGGDPSKIEEMREAFKKGYKQAEKTWGGQLPDISQRTYDAVMQKFDKLAEEAGLTTSN